MIDTIKISHNLQSTGLTREQSEAIAQAILEAAQIVERLERLEELLRRAL